MVMNRRGITALMDAVFLIALIAIASTMIIQVTDSHADDTGVQSPSDLLDAVFDGKMRYTDLGIEAGTSRNAQMPDLAYASMSLEDDCFKNYIESMVNKVYSWNNAYHLVVSTSGQTIEIGSEGVNIWMSAEKSYQTSFKDDVHVTLVVYR